MSIVTPDTKLGWLIMDGEEYRLINENPLTQEAFDIIENNKLYLASLYLDRRTESGDTNLIQKIFKRDKVRVCTGYRKISIQN